MTLRKEAPRAKTRWSILAVMVTLGLAVGATLVSASVSSDAGFEGADANLVHNSAFDWNDFAATSWTGTAPYRQATKVASGWTFTGIEDAQKPANPNDTIFVGGTKQDNDCPGVKSQNPPNKDDLKRIYLANKTVGTHVYLALAWERIPQNTTSASAHVAFEFNQADPDVTGNACPAGSDSLVHRSTANGGDMLIVYDFEGGSGAPVLKLLRWKTAGTCEQTGKTATAVGCWVNTPNFTSWEAAVNTSDADDTIGPSGTTDTLHSQEFGEAIVDLTAGGVLDPTNVTSCTSFGRSFAVSRSSGNSGTAAMEDLVGPADVNITNCATVIIHKVTVPSTDTTTSFAFTKDFSVSGDSATGFNLTGGAAPGGTKTYSGTVFPKTGATVTETDPSASNYLLTSISCTSGSTATNISTNSTTAMVGTTPARTVKFDIAAGQTLECTFTNTLQKVQSAMDTAPWIYPNDKATVNAATGQTDIVGNVTFRLYGGATAAEALTNCQANLATGLRYAETVNLSATAGTSKTVNTSNPGTTGSPTSYKVESSATLYWRVEYTPTGDANHLGRLSDCVENIATTLTGATGGANVP